MPIPKKPIQLVNRKISSKPKTPPKKEISPKKIDILPFLREKLNKKLKEIDNVKSSKLNSSKKELALKIFRLQYTEIKRQITDITKNRLEKEPFNKKFKKATENVFNKK